MYIYNFVKKSAHEKKKKPFIFFSKFPYNFFQSCQQSGTILNLPLLWCGQETLTNPPSLKEETIEWNHLALRTTNAAQNVRGLRVRWGRKFLFLCAFWFSLLDGGDRELVTAKERIMRMKGHFVSTGSSNHKAPSICKTVLRGGQAGRGTQTWGLQEGHSTPTWLSTTS